MGALCAAAGILALAVWSLQAGPADLSVAGRVHLSRAHYVMGTIFEIEVYASDRDRAEAAVAEAFERIREADRVMSHYREDSDLSRLNGDGARGPVALPGELYSLLEESVRFSRMTGGAFDITASALWNLWKRAAEWDRPPADKEIGAVLESVGADRMRFHPAGRAVSFDREGVRVDLGGIAKGWAVDRAADALRVPSIQAALISAGTSTLYALGAPPGERAWRVGVRHPASENGVLGVAELEDESLSTSASYERPVMIGGRAYSHILDPRIGRPVEQMGSASVIAPTATESDALSTAVFVLGVEDGERLLEARGLAGLMAASGPEARVVRVESPGGRRRWTAVEAVESGALPNSKAGADE